MMFILVVLIHPSKDSCSVNQWVRSFRVHCRRGRKKKLAFTSWGWNFVMMCFRPKGPLVLMAPKTSSWSHHLKMKDELPPLLPAWSFGLEERSEEVPPLLPADVAWVVPSWFCRLPKTPSLPHCSQEQVSVPRCFTSPVPTPRHPQVQVPVLLTKPHLTKSGPSERTRTS